MAVVLKAPASQTGWAGPLLDRVAASNLLAVLVLLVVSALAFAPGFATLPPMDRDEPRFAQASKQMLESGDFVSIRFQDEARLKKPVGIYWLQATAVTAGARLGIPEARTTIALYRVPSLVAAFGAVLLTWWTALPLVGRRAALLSGLMMAGCVLLGVEARLAKTDATQLLAVMAMVGVLARLYMASRRREQPPSGLALPAIFWLGMAGSILVKGPIGLLLVALTALGIFAATREWRWLAGLRWIYGIAFTLVLVSPWFIAIMLQTKGAFLQQSVGQDMLGKVAGGQESHGAWPGTYLAVFWATFWPFAPLAALAVPWVWARRREPAIVFLLAWLVPFWLVFEFFPTKLPHYVLPAYPAIAMLVAAAVTADGLARAPWARLVGLLIPLMAAALALGGLGGVWFYDRQVAWLALPFVLVAIAASIWGFDRLRRGRAIEAALGCLLTGVALYWGVYQGMVPNLQVFAISPRLAAAARSPQCPEIDAATVGYREPSLVFLAGTGLRMPTAQGAADFLAGGACRTAFVEQGAEPAFLVRLAAGGTKPDFVGRVAGVNINGGHKLDIGVYRMPAAAGAP
ncbi:ArnT family glycosyltransferase [Labrys monachus]|uniref:4-amino-4-deoxy-L-arabinose transferase-like glycosyltransferase n=1 Tax=Labrys monachus TaxID=217067 RepID=A0ABU0FEN9_9HYPH|nr:glycosyltransferase family 39 protein [Labrys monachus]MDQ0393071.1 4-amino-4-deoxy-L-arabinose transferase-like glycosyltransferase [Labrys monachus]